MKTMKVHVGATESTQHPFNYIPLCNELGHTWPAVLNLGRSIAKKSDQTTSRRIPSKHIQIPSDWMTPVRLTKDGPVIFLI
jgi:hypothetical protein